MTFSEDMRHEPELSKIYNQGYEDARKSDGKDNKNPYNKDTHEDEYEAYKKGYEDFKKIIKS